MAWLPFYALENDIEFLNDWLNQEDEVAFIVSQGSGVWRAEKNHAILSEVGKQIAMNDGIEYQIPVRADLCVRLRAGNPCLVKSIPFAVQCSCD